MNEWSLTFSGISPWLFLLLATIAVILFWRLKASVLRTLAALLLLFFLLEPSLTYRSSHVIKPKAVILVDDTQSMEVRGLNSNALAIATTLETALNDQVSITRKFLGTSNLTDFSLALEQLGSVDDLKAIILISDGQQTEASGSQWSGAVPVHGVLLGSPETPSDAVISEISGPESASVSNQAVLKVRYRLHVETTSQWNLVLKRGEAEVARKAVLPAKGWQEQIFEVTPDAEGAYYLTGTLEPASQVSELTLLNNSSDYLLQVKNESLRILILDSTPRWDSRYIAALFERDNRNTVVRKYMSVLANESFFPDSFDPFDAVFIGDFRDSELPLSVQEKLETYASSRGGFLVMQAGPRMNGVTPLRTLLPVRLGPQAKYIHSLAQLVPASDLDPSLSFASPELWKAASPVRSYLQGSELKPGATPILLTTNGTPVAAAHRYGAGRVLWVGTGETWRWRETIGGELHDKFWLQMIEWGARTKFRGKDERLQIALDKTVLNSGEVAELLIRAQDGEALQLIARNQSGVVKTFNAAPQGELFRANLDNLQTGNWFLIVTNVVNGLSEQTEVIVRPKPSRELIELSSNPEAMRTLLNAGGGMMVVPEQLPALISELKTGLKPFSREQVKTISLWDNYLAIILFTALLSADWLLRKKRGLD